MRLCQATSVGARAGRALFGFCCFFTWVFCQDQTRLLNQSVAQSLHHPSLRSLTATMIRYSELPRCPRGRVPTQALGLNLRPQNDSGGPASERPDVAGTADSLAASRTSLRPTC